jgi:plasmid stabilization system protein ParE
MKIVLHPEALIDLNDGDVYYQSHATVLVANRFLDEFDRSVKLIMEFPNLAAKVDSLYRRLPMNRYPYTIVYRILEDTIRIIAVAHDSRKPTHWHNRDKA